MFPKLRLPVRLKTFKSGLIVVMDSSSTEEVIERNLLRYIISLDSGATALQVGGKFNWSVGVATEILQVYLLSLSVLSFRWRRREVYCVEM